jgi:carbonic anhydrase
VSAIDRLLMRAHGRQDGQATRDPPSPRLRLVILTCMDARVDPVALMGLGAGDAHVIRNAGGTVTGDVLRSLRLSQALGATREIMVIDHTDCVALGFEAPLDAPETTVREAIRRLLASRDLLTDGVRGFVLDLGSGRLEEVEAKAEPASSREPSGRARPVIQTDLSVPAPRLSTCASCGRSFAPSRRSALRRGHAYCSEPCRASVR